MQLEKIKKRKDVDKMKTGIFIAFEGGDHVGKSTISKFLVKELNKIGLPTEWTKEPGGTNCPVSEKIRIIILDPENDICDKTEVLLFAASRAQHIEKFILPSLKKGINVVSDRFVLSSHVYQGIARKMGLSRVKTINNFAREGLKPDITFLLDLDVEKAQKRTRQKKKDRIELENIKFHQKIRKGFLRLAKKDPAIIIINTEQSERRVCQKVLKHTLRIIKQKRRKI